MKTLRTFLTLIMVSLFTSCITINKSGYIGNPGNIVILNDTIKTKLIYNVNNKIEGEAYTTKILGITVKSSNRFASFHDYTNYTTSNLKKAAIYEALKGTNYDVILLPKYTYQIKNYFIYKEITVKVSGTGAKKVLIDRSE